MLLERLLQNLALSIDAFATCRVAPGWRLRLPALDWVTLHYVVRGEGELRDGSGKAVRLPPGSLAVVAPGSVHALQCGMSPYAEASHSTEPGPIPGLGDHRAGPVADQDALVVVCGRIEVTYGGNIGLFDRLPETLVLDFAADPGMHAVFQRLLEETRTDKPGTQAMISTLMTECMISVFRELCQHDECRIPWLRALDDPALARAIEAMLAHPEHDHSVASLAATAFMSRSAFARRFRESLGVTPIEYLRHVRLRQAARLLSQSPHLAVSAVARRVGFASRSQFSHAFRAFFGRAPTQFRS